MDALGVVDERREDDNAENEEENQKSQLVRARLERVNENLESGRVPSQLEQPHDANDAEELKDVVVLLHVSQNVVEVERQSRDEVDDVDRRQSERQFTRTDDRPRNQLERKPHIAHTLDVYSDSRARSACFHTTRSTETA